MSNATQHSRQSGDNQRRRSRGGRNRSNQQNDNRRSDGRESRESREGRGSGRSEEFRPQSPRPPRAAIQVKLSGWQKLLRVVSLGLYKGPKPPARSERKPEGPKPQAEARPAKSNTRNARTSEGPTVEKSDGDPGPRSNRNSERTSERTSERSRGGDRSTVESPRVYVGNLSYEVTEQDLQELFKGIGGVRNVEIVYNRSTHRSKGYGFVEMLHMDEAMRAVEVLHDQPFMGRKLTVSGAKSKGQDERDEYEERPERAQRPVVVAPRPAPVVAAIATVATVAEVVEVAEVADVAEVAEVADVAAAEPMIQTIVETVTETTAEEAPAVAELVAETPLEPVMDVPEEAVLEAVVETPAQVGGESPVA